MSRLKIGVRLESLGLPLRRALVEAARLGVSGVQVDQVVRALDQPFRHGRGDPLGGTAARVAGKAAVEVLAVRRDDERRPRPERRQVDDRRHGDGPGQLGGPKLGQQFPRGGDGRVLGAVHPGDHGDEARFQTVSLTTLVDSPVLAGAHFRRISLTPNGPILHYIDAAADGGLVFDHAAAAEIVT